MRTMWLSSIVAPLALLASLSTAPAEAIVVSKGSTVAESAFRHPHLRIVNLESPPAALARLVSPQVLERQLSVLGAQSGLYDPRGGRWSSLVLRVPLLPGRGAGNTLGPPRTVTEGEAWTALSDYLRAHSLELKVDLAEVAAPRVAVLEGAALVQIHAARVAGGTPVRDSGLSAVISHGNLILLGLQNWGPIDGSVAPRITAPAARDVVAAYLHPIEVVGYHDSCHLEWVPLARGEDLGSLTAGHGYDYRLVWSIAPTLTGDAGSWEALVDALTGELIAFQDKNAYAVRRVLGGVYPVSNDQRPPDGIEQPGWPMPFANVTGAVTSFTTTGGVLTTCERGAIQTTLNGQFVRIADACGPIAETAVVGDIDLGFSAGTDCVVPAGHTPGDTHAARTTFYELNRVKEQARGHITAGPGSVWLDGVLLANVNGPLTCGASWNGTTVTLHRDNSGLCRNPGEIAGAIDHEFGHGVDDNDTNGTLSNPFEGAADVFANLRHNRSCVSRGFFKNMVCGGYGDACDGTPLTGCTGVRDHDWLLHRCDRPHTVTWITQGFTSAECNNTGPAPACQTGGTGPCGRQVHCEGSVVGETLWDLQFRDLRAAPFNFDADTALERATRLNYLGAQLVTNWYTCSVGGGCGATSGYMQLLATDDDNGDLADGTPHMSAIRAAFERHEIHCAALPVANSGCAGGPAAAPTLSVVPTAGGADLTWSPVAGAGTYAVYRTEGVNGCDSGKVKVAETAATRFSDSGLLDGRTYFYSVLPAGANASCLGRMSACTPVVPLLGPDPCVPVELQGFIVE